MLCHRDPYGTFVISLQVIENQKMRAEKFDDETDMIDAFVACGGLADKSGNVKRDTLVSSTDLRMLVMHASHHRQ